MTNNNPALDPANNDSLTGLLRVALNKMAQELDGMLPARVIAFDRTNNRVQVQPLIAVVTTDGSQITRAQIASIPVLALGGGGHMLNFNLTAGDLGWIVANDRDISLFLQHYNEQKPNTNRVHSFSDAIFIPDVMRGYTIDAEDAAHAVFQKLDGTVRVALWADRVKITAPQGLEVDSKLEAGEITCTSITIDGSGTVLEVTGNVIINGNLRVNGDIEATGSITPNVPP